MSLFVGVGVAQALDGRELGWLREQRGNGSRQHSGEHGSHRELRQVDLHGARVD